MTDQGAKDLAERMRVLETLSEERAQDIREIKSDVRELVQDLHARRGREEAERQAKQREDEAKKRAHIEDREDGWQRATWIRSILPLGVITAIFTAAWNQLWAFFTGTAP
jgi:hypothetical protein